MTFYYIAFIFNKIYLFFNTGILRILNHIKKDQISELNDKINDINQNINEVKLSIKDLGRDITDLKNNITIIF